VPHVVAVVGPTATGKSDLGVALALVLGGEVVNADASQLYRGMDIGTAKASVAERHGVPHHLLDVLDVRDEASVAAYQAQARSTIDAILARGAVPVVVGGSGLYVRAVLDELDIPPTDADVRVELEAMADRVGAPAMHAELARVDPVAAQSILVGNVRRVVRALEVVRLTGRPFSATLPSGRSVRPTVNIGLDAPRDVLDERIGRRVQAMWAAGLLDEVTALDARGLREGRTASRAVGYAQALGQLDGLLTQDEARDQTAQLTRRLSRRQRSWFGRDERITWLPHDDPDLVGRALAAVDAAAGAR
jgi:tRNA dimethylallyltransferase